ncbi:NADH:flavin oxidoreductase/NADH oxidase [Propylenella binzhouense]|uniref:NADH:flavin oxidoreductase/NADH oxidase n=1 Tax=Propylenella binzhouense TaxID=2555902 RepID=A0A964T900_9HYPH|nr:NADH:flavin oxidoreductase/NADH oxidase [Propylenella binzhouense]MYZ49557.1 NADH:flavin oxidoreductase/NADH oxidase [Propylenella binzhouense]
MAALFSPFRLGGLELANRITISPMCQYSAVGGSMTDWHVAHLASLALSGAGLLVIEATGVEPRGRISPEDTGLWSDDNEAALSRVLDRVRAVSPIPIGIQLAHAGRKAATYSPWTGSGSVPDEKGGWDTIAPSAVPFREGWRVPRAMTRADMEAVRDAFVAAARRAARLGLRYAELHFAHGYLMSTFLSPLSNRRTDEYGGSLENRMRFPLEVAAAVRAVWPAEAALAVRVNGSDFTAGGWTPEEAGVFARALRDIGMDGVTVSGGGVDPRQEIQAGPGYQLAFAEHVRKVSGIPTTTVGMILTPRQAEAIVAEGKADLVALARAILFDPRWPFHAARVLGIDLAYPPQYDRADPKHWRGGDLLLAGLSD